MISILKLSLVYVIVGIFVSYGAITSAAELKEQTLSVSPTIFQMSANPSQSWASELRVINVNDYEITVYPSVVNFAPSGEQGTGAMIPIFAEETKGQTLAEWVTLASTSVVIPPGQTATIPFKISVVGNAAPGGHYAAILVGTKPPVSGESSAQVQTAQFVSSLLFVRVSGDITEAGNIRELTTTQSIFPKPDVNFDLRFENTGNVHLQPQGDITISNMWGATRGVIPINYETHFGNVLPNSIRNFSFTWTGEPSLYDIGRFKAVATLGYGESAKNFSTSTTYFWIVPLKQILLFVGILLVLLWFLSIAIKLYIKRMLSLAGLEPQGHKVVQKRRLEPGHSIEEPTKTVIIDQYQTAAVPLRKSTFNILHRIKSAQTLKDSWQIVLLSVYKNIVLVSVVVVSILGVMLVFWFFNAEHTKPRPYDVTIVNPDSSVVISSDQIAYRTIKPYELSEGEQKVAQTSFTIELINASGEAGLGAKAARKLEAYGYSIGKISNELNRFDTTSVIIFSKQNQDAALQLSKKLNGALLSVDTDISPELIRIYIGTDNR